MPTALVLVGTMGRADEEVLPLFKIACGGVIELLLAVGAIDQTGENTALSRCRSAMPLLSDFLHLVKDFLRDDGRVCTVENLLIFDGVCPLLFIPDGIAVGLEVDRSSDILHPFENCHNGAFVPTAFVFGCWVRCLSSVTLFVSGGIEYLVLFKLCGDLARTSALHTQVKDFPNDICRLLVNRPCLWILWVLLVPIRDIDGKTVAALALCLLYSTDFAAGVARIKLVKPVFYSGKIVVNAVGVDGVVIVIDGNEAHTVFGKGEVDEHTCHSGVS